MGSYEPIAKKIKLTNMEDKTPVSQLQEFCTQEKVAPPKYKTDQDEHDPKKFVCFVQAFGPFLAKGSGLSKMEAKHAAAASLIRKLILTHSYRSLHSCTEYFRSIGSNGSLQKQNPNCSTHSSDPG